MLYYYYYYYYPSILLPFHPFTLPFLYPSSNLHQSSISSPLHPLISYHIPPPLTWKQRTHVVQQDQHKQRSGQRSSCSTSWVRGCTHAWDGCCWGYNHPDLSTTRTTHSLYYLNVSKAPE